MVEKLKGLLDLREAMASSEERQVHLQAAAQPLSTHQEMEPLLRFFAAQRKGDTSVIYTTTLAMMEACGLPQTPQPAYERSLQQIDEALRQLLGAGVLKRVIPVFFQAHILQTRKFALLPQLGNETEKAFFEAYQAMQAALSMTDALKLSIRNGQKLDLRELAAAVSYSVEELNTLFRGMAERGIFLCELHHAPSAQPTLEREYQMELGHLVSFTQAYQLWSRCGEARLALLEACLLEGESPCDGALRELAAKDPSLAESGFWAEALRIVEEAAQEHQLLLLGGRLLRQFEEEGPSSGRLALWMAVAARLGVASLSPEEAHPLLPHPRHAPKGILALVKAMLSRFATPSESSLLLRYLLVMPNDEMDEAVDRLFVEHQAERLLEQQRLSPRIRWMILRYKQVMSRLLPWSGWGEGDVEEQIALWKERFGAQALAALGWSLVLLGEEDSALPWLRAVQEGSPRYKKLYAQILLHQPALWAQESAEMLRWMLSHLHEAKKKPIREQILRLLVLRDQADDEEMRHVAAFAQESGENALALQIREALRLRFPQEADHPAALARLHLQEGRLREALEAAIEATRLDPRRYVLEDFLSLAKPLLFSDLSALRVLMVDLPAHPALSRLEATLTAREDLIRKLAPALQDLEERLAKGLLEEARQKARSILKEHQELTPPRFQEIIAHVDATERALRDIIRPRRQAESEKGKTAPAQAESEKGRGAPSRAEQTQRLQRLEQKAEEAAKAGFSALACEGLRSILAQKPSYGWGWIKLARLTSDREERDKAYQEAITLAPTAENRQRNLEEWARHLDQEGVLERVLPSLLALLGKHSEEAKAFEPLLLKLIGKHGIKPEVAKELEGFLKEHKADIQLERAEQALQEIEHLDPWKRKLLTLQAQIAQTQPATKNPRSSRGTRGAEKPSRPSRPSTQPKDSPR
jgi:hypothetical protein